MNNTIIFATFANAQGRSREVYSSRQLMDRYPEAHNLKEATAAEAATWDINPIIEIHQGYKDMEDAQDKLRSLIYAVLHVYNVANATSLYDNMDLDNIASTMIHSVYVGQTAYYYYDDNLDDNELIHMVKDNQK